MVATEQLFKHIIITDLVRERTLPNEEVETYSPHKGEIGFLVPGTHRNLVRHHRDQVSPDGLYALVLDENVLDGNAFFMEVREGEFVYAAERIGGLVAHSYAVWEQMRELGHEQPSAEYTANVLDRLFGYHVAADGLPDRMHLQLEDHAFPE